MLRPDIEPAAAMEANRRNWNARVPVHVAPDGYDIGHVVAGGVSGVVRFDAEGGRLGSLAGLDVVHLQCHIGTDTVSLAHLGARTITGLDFSAAALAAAADIAARAGHAGRARWVEASVYDAVAQLGATYDLVYTGVGAINWLPDLGAWAKVIAALLRPGGRFHITESHPVLGSTAPGMGADAIRLALPYFPGRSALEWNDATTYAGAGVVASPLHYEWLHSMSEIIQSLLDAGLLLTHFSEHRVLPWDFLPWMDDVAGWPGWKQMPERFRDLLPLMFTLQAVKP